MYLSKPAINLLLLKELIFSSNLHFVSGNECQNVSGEWLTEIHFNYFTCSYFTDNQYMIDNYMFKCETLHIHGASEALITATKKNCPIFCDTCPVLTTTSPTTVFQGQDYAFEKFESNFVDDDDGFGIELNYTVGKTVSRVNVTLLDKNCTSDDIGSIITLVPDQSVDSNINFLKKVSVNKQELGKSTLVTRSEGSSKGTLSFCVKAEGVSEDDISVSFRQDKLNLSYDLTNNTFEVLSNGLKADDIDTTSKNVATRYTIIAHRCTSLTYTETEPDTPLQQNALVFICIKPNSTDVEISTFNLNFVQDEFTFQVVNSGVASTILSSVYPEGDNIKIVSRLVSAFFNSDTDTFHASGDANLKFKTARRKLDPLRSLSDKDNAGEATFGMNVKLQKQILPQKQSHNISQIALSVFGTCVLLSVLFIAIKKLKRKY